MTSKIKSILTLGIFVVLTAHSPALASGGKILAGVAVSASEPVREAGGIFMAEHPAVEITLNAAASGTILRQMDAGAPVDVVVFADRATIEEAAAKKLVDGSCVMKIAENSIVLAFDKAFSEKIKGIADLSSSIVGKIAVGNPEYVPLGRYVKAGLEKTGGWDSLSDSVVLTSSASQSVSYLARGEVGASFLYKSEAEKLDKGKFAYIALPQLEKASYYAAKATGAQSGAEDFFKFLASARAGEIFRKFGFEPLKEPVL